MAADTETPPKEEVSVPRFSLRIRKRTFLVTHSASPAINTYPTPVPSAISAIQRACAHVPRTSLPIGRRVPLAKSARSGGALVRRRLVLRLRNSAVGVLEVQAALRSGPGAMLLADG